MKRAVLGVCLTSFMAVIIGVAGLIGVMTMNEQYDNSYEYNALAMPSIARVMECTQRLKALPYMALYETDVLHFEREVAQNLEYFEASISEFDVYIISSEVRSEFDEMKNVYFNEYKPLLFSMMEYLKQNESHDIPPDYIIPMRMATNTMTEAANYCMDIVSMDAKTNIDESYYIARQLAMIITVLIALEIVLSAVFIVFIARYKGSKQPAHQNTYARGAMPPVYAMYPADPSNPASPPHATHILYPVMTAPYPPQNGESRQQTE